MKEIDVFQEILEQINIPKMSLLYLSRPSCGICTAIKPKVEAMMADFPEIVCSYVNLDTVPEASGQLSVFTIPAILVYAGGREVVREARYISMDDLRAKIERPYRFIYGENGE